MANTTLLSHGNSTGATSVPSLPPMPTDLASLWTFLYSFTGLGDWAKLFLIGGAIESIRRLMSTIWTYILDMFFLSAEFEEHEEPYNWMMVWLSKQPSWSTARSIQVSTHRYGQSGTANLLPGEEGQPGDSKKTVAYLPAHNRTQYIWFKRTWLQISRTETQTDMYNRYPEQRLQISMFTRGHKTLNDLLLEAKRAYKTEAEDRINLYVADSRYNEWSLTGCRPKRPLSSVVLDKGVKEHLLADARDFMASEKWYAERGIPWRRGYLLHGCPGSGKTSLIHALAGELNLPIYVISLAKRGLDDSNLNELISRLPSRSLALMEDIDAAFYRGLTREPPQPEQNTSGPPPPPGAPPPASPQGVTLSGLLGAIDGVTAQEGRILFATTNKYSALDPALTRPGRLDIHIEFELAGRWQAEELFKCFFPPTMEDESEADEDILEPLIDFDEKSPIIEHAASLEGPQRLAVSFADNREPCPPMTAGEVSRLAKEFADRIPEREFSMAAIQGLLMQYKTRPHLAIEETAAWVERERRRRTDAEKKDTVVPVEKIPSTPPTTDEKIAPSP
ncbi:P-loop containing nucleoside triphosphate hydrolase protein [Rickenella mellea]|uniref:P-loop containing nucleoside triphosphate hydrolase protein n=1 Tax=Rickenella mellea TaxID=50990 RepID=A0A4Y7PQQ3_9AGAM|nr:P-loop containing nucleoside triphosphate hydrolase protein [Rickenella mellea]